MGLITIQLSVGRNGKNLLLDVAAIGAALVAIGPDRGGIFAVPLSIEGLAEAIKIFQDFQTLPSRDGRVDPAGGTLRRLNEVLNGRLAPPTPPAPTPTGTGALRAMTKAAGLATSVSKNTWTPIEESLKSEMVFKWTGAMGSGNIFYFEIDGNVVPKWFGVLVPQGTTDFSAAHIFFHPTPGQAGFKDPDYQGLGNWSGIFHYLTDAFGAQFCAAGTGRVLIMPLMPNAAAGTCGNFPRTWEATVGKILGALKSGDMSGTADAVPISSVVVSSFSSGITYSHHFRAGARLGTRLTGVIDFDGGISSYSSLSSALSNPTGRVVRMQQMGADARTLGSLAQRNVFPLPQPRWSGPYENLFSKVPKQALLQIHGTIPQTMMFIAAKRAG